jgi:hypothetical protein
MKCQLIPASYFYNSYHGVYVSLRSNSGIITINIPNKGAFVVMIMWYIDQFFCGAKDLHFLAI